MAEIKAERPARRRIQPESTVQMNLRVSQITRDRLEAVADAENLSMRAAVEAAIADYHKKKIR